jgi:hypothetical protein
MDTSPEKINVTSKFPVGNISVVTLIRTDTTLDHSQKAEKVCLGTAAPQPGRHFTTEQPPPSATLDFTNAGTNKYSAAERGLEGHF